MSIFVSEQELPDQLDYQMAVSIAYSAELSQIAHDLQHHSAVLIECDKNVAPFLYFDLRDRLRESDLRLTYLDGRLGNEDPPELKNVAVLQVILVHLRNAVRGPVAQRVIGLPHLDLLTNGDGRLTPEAREAIPLLCENPDVVWLGFKDPSLPLPLVIENIFSRRYSCLGVRRSRLGQLVTRRESRKFGRRFSPWSLYQYVSGASALDLRKRLSSFDGEDYPEDANEAFGRFRQLALTTGLAVPQITFNDIGGYAVVKRRFQNEILAVLDQIMSTEAAEEREELEGLLVRGVILTGLPSDLKRRLACALAQRLNGVFLDTAAPNLTSPYPGGQANIRQLFRMARQAAPAVIFVNDLHALAAASSRATSDIQSSELSQFLHEMESLHDGELVFVVGAARHATHLDRTLFQPGLFELTVEVGDPHEDDRREILKRFDQKLGLSLTENALEKAVALTAANPRDIDPPSMVDRLELLCRNLARLRVREHRLGPSEPKDVEQTWSMMTLDSSICAATKPQDAPDVAAVEAQDSPSSRRRSVFSFRRKT